MLLISLVWAASAAALDVKLQWSPNEEPDLSGYKVCYGVNDLSNPTCLDVKNVTNATVPGLDPAKNYTFAVKAYNTSGLESSYSNPVIVLESIRPVVTSFKILATPNSLTVAVSPFIATDNAGVTGYLVTNSSTLPDVNAAGWSASAPTSYTFPVAGVVTAYAWVKDAANNVSASVSATSSLAFTAPLTLAVGGSGEGTVNDGNGLTCSTGPSCPAQNFAAGTIVTLMPTASQNSVFAGWSGACTNVSGSCTVTMDGAKTVGATFSVNPVAWIPPSTSSTSYFGLLSDSYNAAGNGVTIKARVTTFSESLNLNRGVGVALEGGYNAGYLSNVDSYTTLDGTITIQSGSLTVAGLVIL